MDEGEEFTPRCGPEMARGLQDRRSGGVQGPQRPRPERDKELRPQQHQLAVEVRPAGRGRRSVESVPRRPALEDVEHPELRFAETEASDPLVEDTAGPSDERDPGPVLRHAWGFSHEDDARSEAAPVDDRVRPGVPEGAESTADDLLRQGLEVGACARGYRAVSGGVRGPLQRR